MSDPALKDNLNEEKESSNHDEGNTASEKTILHNRGLRDNDFIEEDGNVVKRYWIELQTFSY